ncbi:MAG: T9SS type A sorting domain-containing protein [Candidatus Kapabacteria bacterium]|nr:T9SS type A sorting domain-containing protein [Candidatus Kapabacteria bacterium]
MRRVILSVFLISFFVLTNYNEVKATDWTGKIPPPCDYMQSDPNSNTSYGNWQGPFEYTYESNVCIGCKMHVVYNQRIITITTNPPCVYYDTELSIGGIFYESTPPNYPDCSLCSNSKSTLIAESIKKIYLMNSERQSFRDSISPGGGCGTWWLRYAWTTTFCKGASLSCSQKICCARPIEYIFDGNSNDLIDVRQRTNLPVITFPLQFVCPPPCTSDCDDIIFQPYVATQCPIPCDYGDWTGTQTITFPFIGYGCPGCMVTAKYKTRTCGEYTDYSFDEFILSQPCNNLITINNVTKPCIEQFNPDYQMQLKQGAMEAVLSYKFLTTPLLNNECITSFREISSNCWTRDNNYQPDPLLPPTVRWIKCDDVKCCYSTWKVCKIDNVLVYTKINTTNYLQSCPNGCVMICGDYPHIIDTDKDDKGMINPVDNGKTILHFNKTLLKGENFQVQIYNMNGIELSKTQYNSSEDIKYFAFKPENLNNGNYYFLITQKDKILSKGILNVKE